MLAGVFVTLIGAVAASSLVIQVSAQSSAGGSSFDVVSVKRNLTGSLEFNITQRPDGSLLVVNAPVSALIARAYPPAIPREIVGLPPWSTTERYDVDATSTLS